MNLLAEEKPGVFSCQIYLCIHVSISISDRTNNNCVNDTTRSREIEKRKVIERIND